MKIDKACDHYRSLKARMRREAREDLEWYEGAEKTGWHYTSITFDNYLRLFFRVVWTSGFKAQIVFDKEEAYFQVLYRTLYPNGKYDKTKVNEFLTQVADILGGHSDNRKNKAVAHLVGLVEQLGWEVFKAEYISPTPAVRAKLLALPMIGPKTVKLLLNQTGISDVAKDDIWVTRFAEHHGFFDPHQCVKIVAEECGDDQTTVDAVLFWAGRTHALDAGNTA
jgi:hypothetical protein